MNAVKLEVKGTTVKTRARGVVAFGDERAVSAAAIVVLGLLLMMAQQGQAAQWRWVVSSDTQRWIERPAVVTTNVPAIHVAAPATTPATQIAEPSTAPTTEPSPQPEVSPPAPLTIFVDPAATAQKIDGWGGCFNEIGWRALLRLDDGEREQVLRALFDPQDGLGFNIGRVPIGASDFALSPYSLDDVPGDLELKHFSIERDRFMLIPYIKAAKAIRADLKLFASPWSPPAWMKTSNSYRGGSLKQEPEILKAYANYLARFVEDYRDEGIDVFSVHVQNEPAINTKYPSCVWRDPATMRDFIHDYAAPTFAKRHVPAQLWLGTITNGDFEWFKTVLDDPKVLSAIGGVGIQYQSRLVASRLRASYPNLTMWETETPCFNGHNDWPEAEQTFKTMQQFIRGGASAYNYWNMVLDQTGLSSWAWSQDSTVVIDSYDGHITYTPQYYLMKHLSAFVKPGATFLQPTNESDPVLAFKTSEGNVIVVVTNTSRFERTVTLQIAEQSATVVLPAHSFSTFVGRPGNG